MTSSIDSKVHLRALEPEDLDLLYAIENDPEAWDAGSAPAFYSRYLLKQYIATAANDIRVDGQLRLVAQMGSEAIGLADLTAFDPVNARAEVGMVLLPAYRGKGLAVETLLCLVRHARRLHLHQLWATVAEGNTRAASMLQRAGFTQTALLRDWLHVGDGFADAQLWQLLL